MPADMFLEIVPVRGSKIKGESMDSGYEGLIEVDKFEVGLQSPSDFDQGKTGRVTLDHAKFDFGASIASTALFQLLCTNAALSTVTLTVRRASGGGEDATYLRWRFNNARLVSYKMEGEDEYTDDHLEIAYSGVEISYRQQSAGKLGPPFKDAYDSAQNKMIAPTLPDEDPKAPAAARPAPKGRT
jgi:type VI secretion system Hcp family effector